MSRSKTRKNSKKTQETAKVGEASGDTKPFPSTTDTSSGSDNTLQAKYRTRGRGSISRAWQLLTREADPIQALSAVIAMLAIVFGVGSYVLDEPTRTKQKHYQAWQVINSAHDQGSNGGRIEALQDLNSDRVSLAGLTANKAHLRGIQLPGAYMPGAIIEDADFLNADFKHAYLQFTSFQGSFFHACKMQQADMASTKLQSSRFQFCNLENVLFLGANLEGASFYRSNLRDAIFDSANLQDTDFEGADIMGANFKSAKNLMVSQLKAAQNWQGAVYDQEIGKELCLTP